jgi:putative endonuclease
MNRHPRVGGDPILAVGEARKSRVSHSMDRQFYVYILASAMYGTLYVGVTNDLVRRVWEHREDVVEGFTREYGVHRLVWYEVHGDAYQAITREKQIKKWNRDWKVNLIQRMNPGWDDLYDKIIG